jgi:hypothetical protein
MYLKNGNCNPKLRIKEEEDLKECVSVRGIGFIRLRIGIIGERLGMRH